MCFINIQVLIFCSDETFKRWEKKDLIARSNDHSFFLQCATKMGEMIVHSKKMYQELMMTLNRLYLLHIN